MNWTAGPSHLGDCCWAAHALMRMTGEQRFYSPREYRWQLMEMLPDVQLWDIREVPPNAANVWIASGLFAHKGIHYEHNVDLIEYLMRWGNAMLGLNGDPEVYQIRSNMMLRFPAIQRSVCAPEFDVLVINPPPRSGQCPGWYEGEMNGLIAKLSQRHKVICTNSNHHAPTISASLCGVGNLSLRAKLVVSVASGPVWGALNIWRTCPIYLFLHPIRLDYGGTPIPHASNVSEMEQVLTRDGWL